MGMSDNANMMSPDRMENLVKKAKKSGADHADAVFFTGSSSSVSWRLGKLEDIERSENSDLGLRVIIGKNQAIVSSSDMSDQTLEELVSRALDMAKNTPEDPYCGLADKKLLALDNIPELDLCDSHELDGRSPCLGNRRHYKFGRCRCQCHQRGHHPGQHGWLCWSLQIKQFWLQYFRNSRTRYCNGT